MSTEKSNSDWIKKNNQTIDGNSNDLSTLENMIDELPNRTGSAIVDWDEAPIATKRRRGIVQIGDGINVEADGTISVTEVGDNVIQTMTGEQISKLDEEFSGTCLCTETYDEIKSGVIYIIQEGEITSTITIAGGGGGGGQLNTNSSETISELEQNIAVGTPITLKYNFITTAIGKGTAKLLINGVLKSTKVISQGENEFDVSQYIVAGTNYITISISDSNSSVVNLEYIINGIKLTLTSSFNSALVYTSDITFRYVVVGSGTKDVIFSLDGEIVDTITVKGSGNESTYVIKNLTHGVHQLEVYARTILNDVEILSNTLSYKVIFAEDGITTPIIVSNFSTKECKQGELLNIDYLVYDPLKSTADVQLQINDETPLDVQVDRTTHYWTISNYPIGDVKFKISCREESLVLPVTVEEVVIDIEPVTENLQLYLTAANRSNAELSGTREVWKYNDVQAQLSNFNWASNGWLNGALKLTGFAQAYIPFNIFDHDIRTSGKTIEIEFETHNVSDLNSKLITCWDGSRGIQITSTECIMVSEQEKVSVRFKENEKYRVSIVIDDMTTNRLIKTYINGILSGISQYSLQDNFQQTSPVGITINEDGEEIDIYSIRIYNAALTSKNVLNNYICDLTDINEKLIKYQSNNVYDIYGDISFAKLKSMIPILQITGELPSSKGDKKKVSTIYQDPVNPTLNFEYNNCTIDIQGTSSQYFPKKNYKIKFPEKFAFYEGATPEKTYTFKADYMESSHSHNTGNALFINSLYDELFPTQTTSNGVRNTIYGFPCAIFYRASEDSDYEYFGAYNFNNDKSNTNTLGLTTDKAESWEFCNNTSDHCLLRSDDFSEESNVSDDFEARYPDGYTDYTALQKVVSWIVSTDGDINKFKAEFPQHFNVHYCLIYYVMMEFALMVDSRAKNMFFDTTDGEIWYPRFYDMDTCYGLNNEGVLDFGYGLEQHDSQGSLKVYNGENSLFWNNFEEAFSDEIQRMYLSLRASGKLSYDSVMAVLKDKFIDKFNEAQYNEDAKFKYINPINESGDTTYLYAAQGTRLAHLQWWVYNRLKYLDSKYETPEFISDFITMRLYTDNGDFNLTPYIDQYLKIKFGSTNVKVRGQAGISNVVPAPSGLKFNDTETIIYGGSEISDLGDLSDKYAGTVDVSRAAKLKKLKLGNSDKNYENTNLKKLSLGNNNLLESIDIQNCPNLTGNLDVSGCIKLNEFLAQGTGLTGVSFVDGGNLRIIRMPSSLTSLIIKNHQSIEELTLDSSMNIQTLILKNTNIDAFKLLVSALNITRLYIYLSKENNAVIKKAYLDYLIDNCGGIDDNMMNMQYPNIQGYLTVQYDNDMTKEKIQDMKDTYALYFPELNITYVAVSSSFTYNLYNDRVTVSDKGNDYMVIYPSREEVIARYQNRTINLLYANTKASPNVVTSLIPNGYDSVNLSYSGSTNLKTLKVDSQNITNANFYNCKSIKEIDLKGLYIGNRNFNIAQCESLEKISNYYFTNNIQLDSIFYNCYNLRELDFTGCNLIRLYAYSPTTFQNLYNVRFINAPQFRLYSTNTAYFKSVGRIDHLNLLIDEETISGDSYYGIINNCHNLKTIDLHYGKLKQGQANMRLVSSSPNVTDINVYLEGYDENLLSRPVEWKIFNGINNLKNVNVYNIPENLCFNLNSAFTNDYNLQNINAMFNITSSNSLSFIFYNCYNLQNLTCLNGNSSNIDSMYNAFTNCYNLKNIDFNFDISNVQQMGWAFENCYNLSNINLDGNAVNIVNMYSAFRNCYNANINLDVFSFNNIDSTEYAFSNAKIYSKTKEIELNNINNAANMFYKSRGLDLLSINMNNISDCTYMFSEMKDVKSITLKTNMNLKAQSLFRNSKDLETLDLSYCTNIFNVPNLCNNCSNLTNVIIDNNTFASGASLDSIFAYTGVNNIDFLQNKLHNINNLYGAFQFCNNIKEVNLDLFSNNAITNNAFIDRMFYNCSNLQVVTGNVFPNTMRTSDMFSGCENLEKISIHEPNNIFVSSANSFLSMFPITLENIKEIDLSGCKFNSSMPTNNISDALLRNRENLKILNLSNCTGITEYSSPRLYWSKIRKFRLFRYIKN